MHLNNLSIVLSLVIRTCTASLNAQPTTEWELRCDWADQSLSVEQKKCMVDCSKPFAANIGDKRCLRLDWCKTRCKCYGYTIGCEKYENCLQSEVENYCSGLMGDELYAEYGAGCVCKPKGDGKTV